VIRGGDSNNVALVGRAIVAKNRREPARHGGEHPPRDLVDAAVTGEGVVIDEIKVAGGVHGDCGGIVQHWRWWPGRCRR